MIRRLITLLLIVGCEETLEPEDCAGVAGGTAILDDCGVCAGNNSTCFKPLDFFEEEVLGKWYRYHGYDDSGRYLILKSDRTGCKWEKPSSGGKKDYKSYVYWELQKTGTDSYKIMYGSSATSSLYGNDIYRYTLDEIRVGGYENLDMHRSSTSYTCE